MKYFTKTQICTFFLAIFCSISTSMFAVQVTDSLSFAAAFADLQSPTGSTSGAGGVIELTANLTFRLTKNQTYLLASTATSPIEINTHQFSIISSGTGTSVDNAILQVGDNMNIHGTATVLTTLARGKILVTGGLVKTDASAGIANSAAIYSNQGWVSITGGKVSVQVAVATTAFAVSVANYMTLSITGGTIEAIGDNTRAVSASDGNGTSATMISGATITATGNGAYAVQALLTSNTIIGDNTTITTSSTAGTDAALVGGGASSVIIVPATAANVTITSSKKYKLDNTTATVIDFRGVTLTANPVDGTAFVNPTNVTLTAAGNESVALNKIYYNYDANPTGTSSNIASGGSVLAPFATTTIKASLGIPIATYNTTVYTFTYTVQNPSSVMLVGTFAALQAAFTAAQTATGTTQVQFTADITSSGAYSFVPDATHPVTIDANGKSFIVASSGTLGGNLSITSTTTTGIIKITGATVTNITGGTYTVNGSAPIIYANSGSGVDLNATKINISNSTFTVNGTTSTANIVKFGTNDGNLLSATGCTFNVSAKGIAFNTQGPKSIILKNCTLNMAGNDAASIAFKQNPGKDISNLTLDGLNLNMTNGIVSDWAGGNQNFNINTIIKDLTIVGSPAPSVSKPAVGLTGTGVKKLYDFRAFTPTVSVPEGSYNVTQSVALSLSPTTILPVDAVDATIVYTLDGTDPIATGTIYTTPITVSNPATLKMASIQGGFTGKVSTFIYTISGTSVAGLEDESGLSISPTIVENTVTINKMAKYIQVFDLAGKLMLQKSNVTRVDMSILKPGVFLIKVVATDSATKTIKVVKL